jgi:hypothetical protein
MDEEKHSNDFKDISNSSKPRKIDSIDRAADPYHKRGIPAEAEKDYQAEWFPKNGAASSVGIRSGPVGFASRHRPGLVKFDHAALARS